MSVYLLFAGILSFYATQAEANAVVACQAAIRAACVSGSVGCGAIAILLGRSAPLARTCGAAGIGCTTALEKVCRCKYCGCECRKRRRRGCREWDCTKRNDKLERRKASQAISNAQFVKVFQAYKRAGDRCYIGGFGTEISTSALLGLSGISCSLTSSLAAGNSAFTGVALADVTNNACLCRRHRTCIKRKNVGCSEQLCKVTKGAGCNTVGHCVTCI